LKAEAGDAFSFNHFMGLNLLRKKQKKVSLCMHAHESREMGGTFSSAPVASTIPIDPWVVAGLGCCMLSIGKDVLPTKNFSKADGLA
jgi:hypothetical protein